MAALDGPRLALGSLKLRAGAVAIAGRGELTITSDAVRGSLDALAGRWNAGPGEPDGSVPRLTLSTDVVLAAADPWYAAIRWKRLAWRGSPMGELHSRRGRLVVVPGAVPTDVKLEAELESEALPEIESVTAHARLGGGALDVSAAAGTLGGRMTASGNLTFAGRKGRFRIAAHGLDPSRLDPRLAGRVDGHVEVTVGGKPSPGVLAAGELHGKLRGRPLQARFRGSWSDRLLELERGRIRLDGGSLELAGTLTPRSTSLEFAANVPRIELLAPMLTRNTAPAASTMPNASICTPVFVGDSPKRCDRYRMPPPNSTSMPNVKRHPNHAPSTPATRKASTMPIAAAPPSQPSALACCAPL